jgi:hypothetical protein
VEQDLETTFVDAVVRKQDEVELGKWSKSGLSLESKPKKAFEVFPVGSVVKGVVKEIGSEVVKIELNNGLHGNLAVANFGCKFPMRQICGWNETDIRSSSQRNRSKQAKKCFAEP